jgi:hypothetical protein
MEHIIKGDSGDGVPNILSPDNCLAIGERQKMMTANRLANFLKGPDHMDENTVRNYHRNKMMIDLTEIPDAYKKKILEDYSVDKEVGRSQLFDYFMKNKLKNLITDIQDF